MQKTPKGKEQDLSTNCKKWNYPDCFLSESVLESLVYDHVDELSATFVDYHFTALFYCF